MITLAILALIMSIAIPYFIKYRADSQAKACIANMRQIDGAKEQWALETRQAPGNTCDLTELVGSDKYLKNSPACPTGLPYTIGAVGEPTTCQSGITTHALP